MGGGLHQPPPPPLARVNKSLIKAEEGVSRKLLQNFRIFLISFSSMRERLLLLLLITISQNCAQNETKVAFRQYERKVICVHHMHNVSQSSAHHDSKEIIIYNHIISIHGFALCDGILRDGVSSLVPRSIEARMILTCFAQCSEKSLTGVGVRWNLIFANLFFPVL